MHSQEEDVEQLAMNFTAHSNNRVSKTSVMDYLTWLLLRHKEPMVLQVYNFVHVVYGIVYEDYCVMNN